MTLGTIATSVITDIANAVRAQNGTDTRYKPLQLPNAIRALNGIKVGEGAQLPALETVSGELSSEVFEEIADAIREMNGLDVTYHPDEMAAAILALRWPTWALVWDDDTMEFVVDCLPRSHNGGNVVESYEVGVFEAGRPNETPWYSHRGSLKKVIFDESFERSEVRSMQLWFYGYDALEEVWGFEHTCNVTNLTQMFEMCPLLRSIYARAGYVCPVKEQDVFGANDNLVGGNDYAMVNSRSKSSLLHTGPGGLLTDPFNDNRTWIDIYFQDDGRALYTVGESPDPEGVIGHRRICCEAYYDGDGMLRHEEFIELTTSIEITPEVAKAQAHFTNMNAWFSEFGRVTSITGLQYIKEIRSMNETFLMMSSLEEVDLSGIDASRIASLDYCFFRCRVLETIYVDADWKLPDNVEGWSVFSDCDGLVGGAGHGYVDGDDGCEFFRIDTPEVKGYLTVKQ